jgi:hypothetical protein
MYKYLWKKCLEENVIRRAWKKLRKGKTNRDDVIEIDKNLDVYVGKMQESLRNTRPGDVDKPELAFVPPKHVPHIVFENGKERIIYCPTIWEQWVHHIVIQVLAPIIMKHSYKYSCGSLPKRGSHYGKRQMERIIKKGFRNFAKLDIRHFFNRIRLDVVIAELEKIIDDSWFIYLIKVIFLHFAKGLPLGFYPSQWLANFVLHTLDEKVAAEDPAGFIRYMDDMTIADNNKKKLLKIVSIIRQELGRLRLKLKDNYQVSRFIFTKKNGKTIGRKIDFMGFLFGREATVLRKHIMIRSVRCARRIAKCAKIAVGQAQSMISRAGWFKHSDTRYVWETYIKPNVNIKQLKNIVSRSQRRRNSENRVEKRKMRFTSGRIPAYCR